MAIVVVPKHHRLGQGFSKKEKVKAMIHPGRQVNPMFGYQSPAAWISDLTETKKCIILCSFCSHKWNYKQHGYRKMFVPDASGRTSGYQTNGKCDGCKKPTANMGGGTSYVTEETYNLVCVDPVVAKRNARAAWKAQSVRNAINN